MINNEQNYAHIYPIDGHEEYNYENENKRAHSETNGLNQAPISATRIMSDEDYDNGVNIKKVEEENINKTQEATKNKIDNDSSKDLTNPLERFNISEKEIEKIVGQYMLKFINSFIEKQTKTASKNNRRIFAKSDIIIHSRENIKGKVRFANDNEVVVVWNDNTLERLSYDYANENLLIDDFEDDSQYIIANQNSNNEKITKAQKIKDLIAFMQENNLIDNTENAANEYIELLAEMDEKAFESYKKAIYNIKENKIKTAVNGEINEKKDDDIITEEVTSLDSIKRNKTTSSPKKAIKTISRKSDEDDDLEGFSPEDKDIIKKLLGKDDSSTLIDLDDDLDNDIVSEKDIIASAQTSIKKQSIGVPIQIKYDQGNILSFVDQLSELDWSIPVKNF